MEKLCSDEHDWKAFELMAKENPDENAKKYYKAWLVERAKARATGAHIHALIQAECAYWDLCKFWPEESRRLLYETAFETYIATGRLSAFNAVVSSPYKD